MRKAVVVLMALLVPASLAAQKPVEKKSLPSHQARSSGAPCQVKGFWERVSYKVDGQPVPTPFRMRKFISRTHWVWVQTGVDSARYVSNGASGTYTVNGATYTERVEYFPRREYEGTSIPFTYRVEGDHFFQTGMMAVYRDGKKVGEQKLEEEFKRID